MGCKMALWINDHAAVIATAQLMNQRSVSSNTATHQTGPLRKEDEAEAEVGVTHLIHPTPSCPYQIWTQEAY